MGKIRGDGPKKQCFPVSISVGCANAMGKKRLEKDMGVRKGDRPRFRRLLSQWISHHSYGLNYRKDQAFITMVIRGGQSRLRVSAVLLEVL